MQTVLREPNGRELRSPDLLYLRDLMLNKGLEYWGFGSGDVGISYQGEKASGLILVFSKELDGFYVEYIPDEGVSDTHLAISDPLLKGRTVLYIGGQEGTVPLQTIVSRDAALAVVEHFVKTGKMSGQVEWLRNSDIEWPIDDEL